jgi:hypothetical protein
VKVTVQGMTCKFRPATDLCTEALKLLDSVSDEQGGYILDLKARAHISTFILRAPDHIDKVRCFFYTGVFY